MTRIHDPPHPGETLRENVLHALGLNVTQAAAQLNVSRAALSCAQWPCRDFAGNGVAPGRLAWRGKRRAGRPVAYQQTAYDLWKARQAGRRLCSGPPGRARRRPEHRNTTGAGNPRKRSRPGESWNPFTSWRGFPFQRLTRERALS